MKIRLLLRFVLKTFERLGFCLFLVFLFSDPAFSLQLHGDPEGLYVHQIAHLFFVVSLAILIYWLFRMKLLFQRGWRFIGLGALLLILWNIDAFVGHWIEGTQGVKMVIDGNRWSGTIKFLSVSKTIAVVYYFAKLDHLLCVPAVASIFLGLREFYADSLNALHSREKS